MESIVNNPFRILGVEANFKASSLQANLNKIKAYTIAETLDELLFEFDFPALGQLVRSDGIINNAKASLDMPHDKIKFALFWFYKGGSNDIPAFDCLKDGDLIEATENWRRVTSSEINERNFSAFHNLSTLNFFQAWNIGDANNTLFSDAIRLKLKFLESAYLYNFCNAVADSTYKKSKEEIQLLFLESINQNFVKNGKVSLSKLLEILHSIEFSSKTASLKIFVQQPIENIENNIEQSKIKRKNNPSTAAYAGVQLFNQTEKDLNTLQLILGKQDLKYGSIADKLADEILQCGIDYFKLFRDSDITDPGISSLNCLKLAKSIACGAIITQRSNENLESLQEWIDDKPVREKQQKILTDLERLKNIMDEYDRRSDTVSNANQLIISARPYLTNVKNVLGANDQLYLGLSSRIASDAQNMLVAEINNLQDVISNTYDNVRKLSLLIAFKGKVNEAWDVTSMIGNMDLVPEFRARYNTNKESLYSLKTQLAQVGSQRVQGPSSGCYVATMVYGNYDHPQVMVLRKFRDEVLNNCTLGKQFIHYYYKHSPIWVEQLRDYKLINKIIRILLNNLIKLIKQ